MAFFVEEWVTEMDSASGDICLLGQALIAAHRKTGGRAEEVCENWKLSQRQAEARQVLDSLFLAARDVLEKLTDAAQNMETETMYEAAEAIERNLPIIEDAFLAIRHCAQDLLHWAQRYAVLEGSTLPDDYRKCHARLIAFTPVLKPRLESLQMKLLERVAGGDVEPGANELLSAITRYNAVLDTARRFIRAVVEPPLDLVFAETSEFLADVDKVPLSVRGAIASELNDCCQSLQYDRAGFEDKVVPLPLQQPEGVDSSLVVFDCNGMRILMTVDEDPIFEQITIHLLRAVSADEYGKACTLVTEALCDEWR